MAVFLDHLHICGLCAKFCSQSVLYHPHRNITVSSLLSAVPFTAHAVISKTQYRVLTSTSLPSKSQPFKCWFSGLTFAHRDFSGFFEFVSVNFFCHVLLWIKYGFMRCANHYILFLFTFYTFSHIGVVTGLCFSSFQLLFSDWLVYRENLLLSYMVVIIKMFSYSLFFIIKEQHLRALKFLFIFVLTNSTKLLENYVFSISYTNILPILGYF